jgi:hypothetical protein
MMPLQIMMLLLIQNVNNTALPSVIAKSIWLERQRERRFLFVASTWNYGYVSHILEIERVVAMS